MQWVHRAPADARDAGGARQGGSRAGGRGCPSRRSGSWWIALPEDGCFCRMHLSRQRCIVVGMVYPQEAEVSSVAVLARGRFVLGGLDMALAWAHSLKTSSGKCLPCVLN